MEHGGLQSTRALPKDSPAGALAQRLAQRTSQLGQLAMKLDDIYRRLHGPRPEPSDSETAKEPPPSGFFDALDWQANAQETLLDRAHQRADQILEALTL